ncbi:MAG: PfkB family carbohydrate kinase [Acidobacteriota bacterium]|nr:PfkB family carbohydrate kinase [Acidobacteriota bacterium]
MTVEEILAALPKTRALVVGDICLDRWCTYDPALSEPSRETGIPRTGVVSVEVTPGAGGTVANNLAALGVGRVAVLGAVGDDGSGYELARELGRRGISTDLLLRYPEFPTFTYSKLINKATGQEDQPRVDFIYTQPPSAAVERELIERLRAAVSTFDAILVSDQTEIRGRGIVTAGMRQALAELAQANPQKVIWVDSRVHASLFRGVIVKPNAQEAEAASLELFGEIDFERLRRHLETKLLFVTQGPQGVLVCSAQGEARVLTRPVAQPVDICGAGDSFSAGAAVALAITGSAIEAARFGNLVASVTIMKIGTGTASPAEILEAERA